MTLHQMGYFGSCLESVWFNPTSIANIMSLSSVAKYYRVFINTANDDAKQGLGRGGGGGGGGMHITPTQKGVSHHPFLGDNDDFWTFLIMVSSQVDKYTNRAVGQAQNGMLVSKHHDATWKSQTHGHGNPTSQALLHH